MILFVIQILMTLVMNNHENFVQNQSLLNEWSYLIQTFHLMNSWFSSLFKTFLSLFQALFVVILQLSFFSVLIFIRSAYVKSCVVISEHRLLLSWSFDLFISRNHLETWLTSSYSEDLTIFISWSTE
jgi:hypothetical protein